LLAKLDNVTTATDLNVSLVKSEMRDKAGVDAATLANNWGIGSDHSKGGNENDSPKSDQAVQDK
jgi:hypothetical protein